MIPEWFAPVIDGFNGFVAYFQAQDSPVQVLLIALTVLAFIAAGFVIYGAVWVAYQAVKGAIVGTILLVWLTIAGIVLLVMVCIDAAKAELAWQQARADMKWFAEKAYSPKIKAASPVATSISAAAHPLAMQQSTGPQHIVIRVNDAPRAAPTIAPAAKHAREVPAGIDMTIASKKSYCTACGSLFSNQMHAMLDRNTACFCEHCGQQFTRQDTMAALA
jgi:DNA-binding transcriptional regulator YdaS (Cro superfamily)